VSAKDCDTSTRRRRISDSDADIIRREVLAASQRAPFTERQIAERYCISPARAKRIRLELSRRLDIVKVGTKACRTEYASARPHARSQADKRVRDLAECALEENMKIRNKVMYVGKDGTTYTVDDGDK
jgi:hypothetical protein